MRTRELISVPALAITFCIGVLTEVQAAPILIDFDFGSGVYSSQGSVIGTNTYTEDGFQFQTPLVNGSHFDSQPPALNKPFLVFHEGFSNLVNNIVTLSFGGSAFDFTSFDLILDAPSQTTGPNPAMTVTASDGQTLSTTSGFAGTVLAGWGGISSVTFDIVGVNGFAGTIAMDNVVLNDNAGTVPEPATLSLLVAGLLGFGAMRRRRIG